MPQSPIIAKSKASKKYFSGCLKCSGSLKSIYHRYWVFKSVCVVSLLNLFDDNQCSFLPNQYVVCIVAIERMTNKLSKPLDLSYHYTFTLIYIKQ
ncbi:MAG: hypothetical protein IJ780_00765 [Neisseriaceae bacterium]|nr:hypothetical protein [Neisseriaceae bacterium]